MGKKIVIVDNYDSFTYNLSHLVRELGAEVTVLRNDKFEIGELEQFDGALVAQELLQSGDLTVGIDIANALGSNVYLVFSDRGMGCNDLAVEIGKANAVVVDQVERTDARPRKRFHNISADAADAENRHASGGKPLHGAFSE